MRDKAEQRREDFVYFEPMATRWMDNDICGHVNNVVYYAYFDTCANSYLIQHGGLDPAADDIVGFIVHSECDFFRPLVHPQQFEVALRVNELRARSAQYGLGIFSGTDAAPHAIGAMVHVFVARSTAEAVPIPATIRTALEALQRA